MSFYRTLLWWLALAALGALAWELLSPDLGNVVVRWHGQTLTTTVAFALVAWGLLSFALWALWTLLRLPFVAWREHAQRQSRLRLVNGLVALYQGRYARAEGLLAKAAEEADARTVARLAAREAALRRGDLLAAATQLAALSEDDPLAAALHSAEALLGQGHAQDALDLLQPWLERKALPPRGHLLRGDALCALGRASDALPSLAVLRTEQSLGAEPLAALERRWQAAALHQAPDAAELLRRWRALPAPLLEQPELIAAFAARGAALGLEAEAAETVADALDRQWQESLVAVFAQLPAAREDLRLARAERWLATQPTNAALSLCLGRLCRQQQLWGKADDLLNRAIAQGAGAEAWEELGHVQTARDDAASAQICYANALRALRGEPAIGLSGRSLREQIAAEAAPEQRNEHGLPHLPR